MPRAAARPRRKQRDQYHHGDLRRALLDQALRIIRTDGVEAVTLRTIGEALGVSRTALYRHFADKRALLSTVATEGFRLLHERLLAAWTPDADRLMGSDPMTRVDARGLTPVERFNEMGRAYVRFAIDNPSHYRVMFGGVVDDAPRSEELEREASDAFQALVDSLVTLQKMGFVRDEDPIQLARFIWSAVHGLSMLIIDGQLRRQKAQIDDLIRFAVGHLHTGISREPVLSRDGD